MNRSLRAESIPTFFDLDIAIKALGAAAYYSAIRAFLAHQTSSHNTKTGFVRLNSTATHTLSMNGTAHPTVIATDITPGLTRSQRIVAVASPRTKP